ncbi:MAG: DsbA family protein [Methylobacteriaceae bacterium]|nr:DsbA family protein [Methylobacteriaceae bacterium]
MILAEFFDYNCPYCRNAEADLGAIVARDGNFRLGLVNNAIIGLGSVQSAKVQQAALKLYGPKRAYDFHKAMFAHRGAKDGPVALGIAQSLGLDRAKIEETADSDVVTSVLKRQVKLASNLGFYATPSFMLNGVGILGYPGRESTARMIAAVRTCDKLKC